MQSRRRISIPEFMVYCLLGMGAYVLLWEYRTSQLISDQEMIDHFYQHRSEFQELADTYLAAEEVNRSSWKTPRTDQLKKMAGIDAIGGSIHCWLDNPYSIEASNRLREMDQKKSWKECWHRTSIIIEMRGRDQYNAPALFSGVHWKNYYYIPVDPKIENGRIVPPWGVNGPEKYLGMRVLPSLRYPKWERGECVLRKIEPKWFIMRCRSQ